MPHPVLIPLGIVAAVLGVGTVAVVELRKKNGVVLTPQQQAIVAQPLPSDARLGVTRPQRGEFRVFLLQFHLFGEFAMLAGVHPMSRLQETVVTKIKNISHGADLRQSE